MPRATGKWTATSLAVFLLLVQIGWFGHARAIERPEMSFRQWGKETLDRIQVDFWLSDRRSYSEQAIPGHPYLHSPASIWASSVQLSALAAAARVDASYIPLLRRYADALSEYWVESNSLGGYAVLPNSNPPDRYYDDNAWMVLALIDVYDLTGKLQYRQKAEDTFRFVQSGEDSQLGGGIYWREADRSSKNTCSNAPTATAALRLYQITGNPEYLRTARRLYAWINVHLQDTDGLYFDNVRLHGEVEKTKWSYNSAMMIQTNSLFYAITGDARYLREAERIARAAEARWVRPDTGALADQAVFAPHLIRAFLALYERDGDTHWLGVVRRALTFLHHSARDPNGTYGCCWDAAPPSALTDFRLIDQAGAARAYWEAARYP